nr:MAG TPA_asm: hypothetical protein [Caudoviricetes sp.]
MSKDSPLNVERFANSERFLCYYRNTKFNVKFYI